MYCDVLSQAAFIYNRKKSEYILLKGQKATTTYNHAHCLFTIDSIHKHIKFI